ncbi:ABC transporter ATP-binding protein [Salipiger sp. 1_MG-2023]|uniref:ABC transporter ATP-binding protein n=1 Tax=Salipiger sp. 1_MG-2023 TaxID=3062665 RepID=UPI0026E3508E|nr:ABC transporter ATP-binding protein [Salipiger sp. 1_MG-2023]MDO6588307.1 ABC transporter ATP-binding protein [Salipiger sp. 1_MG-2023]
MSNLNEISVSVHDLGISYGPNIVLDALSIDIRKGEFLVLLGSSGCGKSTLLNAIAGLNEVTAGRICIGGKDVTWEEPKDRGIGMVFQSYALYPRMTVAKNMGFGLTVRGMKREEVNRRVLRAAETLHLTPLLGRRPSDLSGGQRQRVAIGRALVRDVDVFLFDEPLSNLDAQLRNDLRIEIKRLHEELGNTMIYVTHDQVEAMTLADRIAVMKEGRIQQLAPPSEVYAKPANKFVAGFLGSPRMNFIAGTLNEGDIGGTVFEAEGGSLPIPDEVFSTPHRQCSATMGLRPEHIRITNGSDISGHPMDGTVTMVETLGAETIIWCDTRIGTLSIRAAGSLSHQQGEILSLTLDLTQASFFAGPEEVRL